ncbi:MAG TPA: BON domain-containing protein [Polyangia bacterium]|nr:BON domain-containing protein [Polyangia bacterium]
MRLLRLGLAFGLAGILAGGCAHETAGPSMGGIGGRSEATLDGAYDSVKSGAQATARAAGYVVERVSDSTVRVMREAGLNRVASGISDAWIKTKIKSKMAVDPDVRARDIKVDSDAGVVTLRGEVQNQAEAVKAIQAALDTNGVLAVNAELASPANQADVRTYQK